MKPKQEKEEKNSCGWDQLIHGFVPPFELEEQWWTGHQVFHSYPRDKNYRESAQATACVEKYFPDAIPLDTDAAMLKFASESATLDGYYLEMGVGAGRTINFIAGLNPNKKIYGFDSFKGLPEDWQRKEVLIPKGSFKLREEFAVPPVLHNVRLRKGMFAETVPLFKQEVLRDSPIAFIHIDSDLYESAKEIFSCLGDNIISGTILLFDEFYNYEEYTKGEFRAFQEFLQCSGKKARYIAFNQYGEQVAVRIL